MRLRQYRPVLKYGLAKTVFPLPPFLPLSLSLSLSLSLATAEANYIGERRNFFLHERASHGSGERAEGGE